MPRPIKWIIVAAWILAAVSVYLIVKGNEAQVLSQLGNLAIVLTLTVLIYYTYYTYVIAKDTMTPSASFAIEHVPHDRFTNLHFVFQNHSKPSLQCYCNLNASINGTSVNAPGFYNGDVPWELQPFSRGDGYFELGTLFQRAGVSYDDLKNNFIKDHSKAALLLDIDFWYRAIGSSEAIRNPRQKYFFDFRRNVIVRDV